MAEIRLHRMAFAHANLELTPLIYKFLPFTTGGFRQLTGWKSALTCSRLYFLLLIARPHFFKLNVFSPTQPYVSVQVYGTVLADGRPG
jgi:hypothetical protein